MEAWQKAEIQKNYELLAEDVEPNYIIDSLCQDKALSNSDHEYIRGLESRSSRVTAFIEIIERREDSYFAFVSALGRSYGHIAEKFVKSFVDKPNMINGIEDFKKEFVQRVIPNDIVPNLFQNRFITSSERDEIFAEKTRTLQCEKLFLFLFSPADENTENAKAKAFEGLLQALSATYPRFVARVKGQLSFLKFDVNKHAKPRVKRKQQHDPTRIEYRISFKISRCIGPSNIDDKENEGFRQVRSVAEGITVFAERGDWTEFWKFHERCSARKGLTCDFNVIMDYFRAYAELAQNERCRNCTDICNAALQKVNQTQNPNLLQVTLLELQSRAFCHGDDIEEAQNCLQNAIDLATASNMAKCRNLGLTHLTAALVNNKVRLKQKKDDFSTIDFNFDIAFENFNPESPRERIFQCRVLSRKAIVHLQCEEKMFPNGRFQGNLEEHLSIAKKCLSLLEKNYKADLSCSPREEYMFHIAMCDYHFRRGNLRTMNRCVENASRISSKYHMGHLKRYLDHRKAVMRPESPTADTEFLKEPLQFLHTPM